MIYKLIFLLNKTTDETNYKKQIFITVKEKILYNFQYQR